MAGRLEGKVAVVTGGATVERFVAEGARVVVTDVLEKEGGRLAARLGDNCRFMRHNVASVDDWDAVIAATKEAFGSANILVNNAGISGAGATLAQETAEEYARLVEINQTGCSTAFAR